MKIFLLALQFAILSFAPAFAGQPLVAVDELYVTQPIPGQIAVAAYMRLTNESAQDVHLVSVTTPVARLVQIHTTLHEGGMMRMRELESLAIPAGRTLELAPMGTHLMLVEIDSGLFASGSIALELHFSDGSSQLVDAPLRAIADMAPQGHQHH